MGNTCYDCGAENAEVDAFCRACGASLARTADLWKPGIQAGSSEERVLWEKGDIRLTTDAVLIGMSTDSPDVVPLETVHEVVVEDRCVVLRVKDGDDKYCLLDDPTELADLVRDHVFRSRLAQERKERGFTPSD
ncbi:MAG TPA: hypothetical protein VFD74_08010 [Thermoleophilia bacterium]|nr:hypothetical protein [Thermoleophilia bacterium]